MADDNADKPHPATDKRREEYRKEGQFPKARDTTAIASIASVLLIVVAQHHELVELFHDTFRRCHGDLAAIARGDAGSIAAAAPGAVLGVVAPPALAAALGGLIIGGWQSGWRLYPEMLKPKFEKLNPIPQLKNLLNPKNAAFELTLAIGRVGIVGYVCYLQLVEDIPTLLGLTGAPMAQSMQVTAMMLLRMMLKALAILIVLAVMDYAYNHHKTEKSMRMSDQDVKEEMRQYDQDPQMKGKLRQKMNEASRHRIIAAVGQADVVVTNPTHVSVALRYAETDFAPVVIAKGHEQLALRIRTEARKHGIPIMENRALARALDSEVEMGQPVPGQHYVAVAKVLAFVFQIRGHQRRPKPRAANAN